MTTDLEHQKRSRTGHRVYAKRLDNEAKTITTKPYADLTPDSINRSEQILNLLKKKQQKLCDINQSIQDLITEDEVLEQEIMEAEEFDDQMEQSIAQIQRFLQRVRPPAPASTSTTPTSSSNGPTTSPGSRLSNVKLPKLDLPTFSGNYLEWTSFSDLFKGAVTDNTQITDSQKLQYLKASVKGDAAQLLASITITDTNFQIASDILNNRYENKRLIIRAHIQAIISQKTIAAENPKDLRKLVETTEEHRLALRNLGQPVDSQDIFFVYLIGEKLPTETRKFWEISSPGKDPQTYSNLKTFLEERTQALEAAAYNGTQSLNDKKQQSPGSTSDRKLHTHVTSSSNGCECCDNSHKIYNCNNFKALSVPERVQLVKTKGLCFNCLRSGHRSDSCNGSTCRICGGKHNTLLHIDKKTNTKKESVPTRELPTNSKQTAPSASKLTATSIGSRPTNEETFLPTAIVPIVANGQTVHLRAMLDSGSQSNIISEAAVQRLRLRKQKNADRLFGLGGQEVSNNKGHVNFTINPKDSEPVNIYATVLTRVTNTLPSRFINIGSWRKIKEINLADPHFNKPSTIDLIIGSGHFEDLMLDDNRIKEDGHAVYYRPSVFGWIVLGRDTDSQLSSATPQSFFVSTEPENLQRFWEIEELPSTTHWTEEERRCEEHFKSTTTRLPEGRFVVKLPFKQETPALGDSFVQAKRRLKGLLYRLNKDPILYKRYNDFINEFITLEHMEEVPASQLAIPSSKSFYLPHHCVIKDSSTTTKLRVVFDASAKTTSGISLNDRLMVGPKLQKDIFSILIRFRFHQVALSADIAKMYRQVQLDNEDKDFHRILWTPPGETEIRTLRMTRVTYGIASSSYHSIRPLRQLAEECLDDKIRLAINNDMYVDDLLTGTSSYDEAQQLQDNIISTLATAGFDIRKWTSSEPSLVERLPPKFRETEDELVINSDDYNIKTLGVRWNPIPDQFKFTVKLDEELPQTKRQILSEVTRLFDPLGWLAPTTIQLKSFVQLLWMDKLNWDEHLSANLIQQYKRYRQQLKKLEEITLPRRILQDYNQKAGTIQLHVFCDASTTAYAAVIYVRQQLEQTAHTQMIAAKTRVAPIKSLCVPRLELCAALLGAQLLEATLAAINDSRFPKPEIFAWTDSQVTIAWLKEMPRKWKTFVANRVAKIQSIIEADKWNFVPTADNPADCASRGISAEILANHQLWWTGPSWLKDPEIFWPAQGSSTTSTALPEEILETANSQTCLKVSTEDIPNSQICLNTSTDSNWIVDIARKHSDMNRIIRIFCYVRKFVTKLQKKRIEKKEKMQNQSTPGNQRQKQQQFEKSSGNQQTEQNSTSDHQQQPNTKDKQLRRSKKNQKKKKAPRAIEHDIQHDNFQQPVVTGEELRRARIAYYSIIQRNYLPEYNVIKKNFISSAKKTPEDISKKTPKDKTKKTPQDKSKIAENVQPPEEANQAFASNTEKINTAGYILNNLSPFYDDEYDVIRVGGRLANSPYNVDKKFPIIIPKYSPITDKLIRESHLRNLHSGPQHTLFDLRQTIWIPGGLATVKKVIHDCKTCIRFDAKILQPVMGDLPRERVVKSFTFENTGLDYCGPFQTIHNKDMRKIYVAIFVCFSTKAIHIETVNSLTKEDCLDAIKRFTARRGMPQYIYSDNSRTFMGTRGEIEFRQLLADDNFSDIIKEFLSSNHINWVTIPPRTPHFGGLWEAAVKSLKRHLYRTIGRQKLTTDTFTTLCCQIEAILNSRPLTTPSMDINDPLALTPGHFLIGKPITSLPHPATEDTTTLSRKYRCQDKMIRQFWKKWTTDYLSTLQQRFKWNKDRPQLKVGDVVVIKEDVTPPLTWPLARIIEVYDGNDSIVRVAKVATEKSIFIRPVSRLVLLHREEKENDGNNNNVDSNQHER